VTLLDELTRIAEVEFSAIVTGVQAIEPKRRIFLRDRSFVGMWVSLKIVERFGFHWERRHLKASEPSWPSWHPAWARSSNDPGLGRPDTNTVTIMVLPRLPFPRPSAILHL
jgi:hypothetical protein